MNKTPIEWTDYTWNPITGCLRGCSYCYARKMAHRFKRDFTPQLHENRLGAPAKLKKPAKIFVCSMSDLFGPWNRPEWFAAVVDAMCAAPWHTYQLLTKSPAAISLGSWWTELPNLWVGATATDQESWDLACDCLGRLPPTAARWISAEPMMGEIHITGDWVPDWVVVGALTGHGDLKKIESSALGRGLTARLQLLGVPVFQKDSLGLANPARTWPQ